MVVPVSVVIPCFRSAAVIGRALASVKAQTVQPIEVIVVDDFSNDGTLSVLEALAEQYGADWLKIIALDKNGGPGTARNAGWDAATGDYVAFLDADDAWHPKKLELQYGWMAANENVAMSGHPFELQLEVPESPAQLDSATVTFSEIGRWKLLLKNYFPTPTIMLRRDVPMRFQGDKRHSEEYLLACQLCSKGYVCAASDSVLTFIFKDAYGAGGLSADLWKMEKGELDVYSVLRRQGLIGFWEQLGFSALSLAKFLRRCLLVGVRNVLR